MDDGDSHLIPFPAGVMDRGWRWPLDEALSAGVRDQLLRPRTGPGHGPGPGIENPAAGLGFRGRGCFASQPVLLHLHGRTLGPSSLRPGWQRGHTQEGRDHLLGPHLPRPGTGCSFLPPRPLLSSESHLPLPFALFRPAYLRPGGDVSKLWPVGPVWPTAWFGNAVLLEHGHARSFTYDLWLLSG